MKKIIPAEVSDSITIDKVTEHELVAYKCKSADATKRPYAVAVLTKLGTNSYGFVALDYSVNSKPRFVANDWRASIKLASESRQLYAFNNQANLIEAIYNKKIQ